jgi:hypothetical protein
LIWFKKLRDCIGTGIGALQLGIALTGNFGHFNLLTLALCVPLLECGGGAGGMDSPVTSAAEAIATATPLPSPSASIANTAIYYFFGETSSNISAVSERSCEILCRLVRGCGCNQSSFQLVVCALVDFLASA